MKLVYLLLIFGIIYSKTVPNYVFDIYYNVEYKLSQDLYREFTYYPFRLPVVANDKMDVEIKIPNNLIHDFQFAVYEYNYYPNDNEVLSHYQGVSRSILAHGYRTRGQYTIYYYTFQVRANAIAGSYFSIDVILPNYAYTELYFRIDLTKYKYSNIKDIEFLTDYTIDTDIFTDKKIPYLYQIYMRLSSLSEDKMQIQLKTREVVFKNYAFVVDVCQFTSKPSEKEVYYPSKSLVCTNQLNNVATEKYKYYYDFQTEKGISHITIRIINYISDLNYLDIYIYTEKGMKAYIIAIIVLAPILLIGGICGGIYGKRRHDGGGSYSSGPIKI